ncbi:MAG TPA: hypothetical protein VGP12_09155, partial [Nitrosospira sp.]|nr:hypothetical protein [Nitrosospira sp.]
MYAAIMLDKKLNVKNGQTITFVNNPYDIDVQAPRADVAVADAVILFAANKAALNAHVQVLVTA